MQEQSVVSKAVTVAGGVYAPGHLGELTQIVDFDLVDAVLAETRTVQRRLRLLPSRVVVYFVLALALFGDSSYRATWSKLTAALTDLPLPRPNVSSLARARRRIGAAPLRRLFEALAGPVGLPGQPGVCYRGLRTVAVDGTTLHVPDLLRLRRLVIAELARFPALGRVFYDRGPGRTIVTLASIFDKLTADGMLRAEDPHLAATQFNWLVMAEPLNRAMLLGVEETPATAELDRYADHAVRTFLAAYRP